MKTFIAVSLFSPLAAALAFDAPMATPVWKGFELEPQGWGPKPTEPPSAEELLKRQNVQGLIMASDGICGYISGFSASPFGLCCNTCSCGFATTPNEWGDLYCCNTATCESRIPTTCIDAFTYTVLNGCNSECAANSNTMKCTASPYIYCNLAEFEGVNVQALFCDSVTVSHTQSMYTTYPGEIGRVLTPFSGFSKTTTSSSPPHAAASSSQKSSAPPSSSSSPIHSSVSKSTVISPPVNSPTGSAGSQVAPSDNASASSSSGPPIGPIVGGAVGGVALIALLGVLIFLLLRRKPKPANDAAPSAAPPFDGNHSMPPEKPFPPGLGPGGQPYGQAAPDQYGYYHPQQPPQQPQYPPYDQRYSQPPYQQQHLGPPKVDPQYGPPMQQYQQPQPQPQPPQQHPSRFSHGTLSPDLAELQNTPHSPAPTYGSAGAHEVPR